MDSTVIEQARASSGAALAAILQRALSSTKFFSFGELLDLPSVAALEKTDHQSALNVLHLIAFGTLAEYRANQAQFGQLPAPIFAKLQQLSLVTEALGARRLSYDYLRAKLELESDSATEAIIMQCIYAGLVAGKMDQRSRSFEVMYAVGRDIRPSEVNALLHRLHAWKLSIDDARHAVAQQSGNLSRSLKAESTFDSEFDRRVEEDCRAISSNSAIGGGVGQAAGLAGIHPQLAAMHAVQGGHMDDEALAQQFASQEWTDGGEDSEILRRLGGGSGSHGGGRAAKRRTGPGGVAVSSNPGSPRRP